MAERVAVDFENPGPLRPESHLVALRDAHVQPGDTPGVGAVAHDGAAGGPFQFQIAAHVIVVVMGVENVGQRPPEAIQRDEDRVGDGRIDHGGRLPFPDRGPDRHSCPTERESDGFEADA